MRDAHRLLLWRRRSDIDRLFLRRSKIHRFLGQWIIGVGECERGRSVCGGAPLGVGGSRDRGTSGKDVCTNQVKAYGKALSNWPNTIQTREICSRFTDQSHT